MTTPKTTKSKSRTFAKKTDFVTLLNYLTENVETEVGTIEGTTNLDAPEYFDEIKHKIIITVTKIEE